MFPLILLYLVLTIVRPQDYLPALAGVPLLPVVLALAFLGWVVSPRRTLDAPQFPLLVAFLLVLMLSQALNGWPGGMLDQLARFGPNVAAFFVLASACTQRARVDTSMAVFVLSALVLALHGVQQAHSGMGWTGAPLEEDRRIRYVGIFNDPNDLGMLFATALPLALYLGRPGRGVRRVGWLAGAALLLYATYLTNSRGAMLAVLLVAGCYVWYRHGAVIAGMLGVIGLAGMKLLSSRMQELDPDEESAAGRVDAWYSGLDMFKSHPLFGVGPGNFTEYNELTAHNSFVLVLAETGFVGFLIWLALVGYSFWMLANVLRHRRGTAVSAEWQAERTMALALLMAMIGMFAAAFFLSRSYMVVLYLVMAIVTGYYVGARQRHPELPGLTLSASLWRWVPATMGSIAALFVLVAVLLRTA